MDDASTRVAGDAPFDASAPAPDAGSLSTPDAGSLSTPDAGSLSTPDAGSLSAPDAGPPPAADAATAAPDAGAPPSDAGSGNHSGSGSGSGASHVLLDLGHTTGIESVQISGDRVASLDANGHWVLWNATTHAQLASGSAPCDADGNCTPLQIAGSTLLVPTLFQTFSALALADGSVQASLLATTAGIASDGSYLWTTTSSGLELWSPTGAPLYTLAGDFTLASIFAAPDALHIVQGSTLETLTVSSHTTASTTFIGTFASWFGDGTHFLTAVGNTFFVYSNDGAQVVAKNLYSIDGLAGYGNYVWTCDALYSLDDLDTPLAIPMTCGALASNGMILMSYFDEDDDTAQLELVSLGANVSDTTPTIVTPTTIAAFAADGSGNWVLGDGLGLVRVGATIADGPTASLSYGWSYSVAATANGQVVFGTLSGNAVVFELAANPTMTTMTTLAARASRIGITGDGSSVLGADIYGEPDANVALRKYSAADGSLEETWPYDGSGDPAFVDFSYAPQGNVVCLVLRTTDDEPELAYTDLDGHSLPSYGFGNLGYSDATRGPIFSPSGAERRVPRRV